MRTDFTKLPEQIMVDLFNWDVGTSFVPEQLVFGAPEVQTTGNRNTRLKVAASPLATFTGSIECQYNRIDLASVVQLDSRSISTYGLARFRDLLPQINALYQICLTDADIVDYPLPLFGAGEESKEVPLTAGSNSLIYIGTTSLTLLPHEDIALDEVIIDRELDGIVYDMCFTSDPFTPG